MGTLCSNRKHVKELSEAPVRLLPPRHCKIAKGFGFTCNWVLMRWHRESSLAATSVVRASSAEVWATTIFEIRLCEGNAGSAVQFPEISSHAAELMVRTLLGKRKLTIWTSQGGLTDWLDSVGSSATSQASPADTCAARRRTLRPSAPQRCLRRCPRLRREPHVDSARAARNEPQDGTLALPERSSGFPVSPLEAAPAFANSLDMRPCQKA